MPDPLSHPHLSFNTVFPSRHPERSTKCEVEGPACLAGTTKTPGGAACEASHSRKERFLSEGHGFSHADKNQNQKKARPTNKPRSTPLTRRASQKLAAGLAIALAALIPSHAQTIGSLKTEGNEVTGLINVANGKATIGNNGAVAAGLQPADIALNRGGNVRVCAGSAIHIAQTTTAATKPPLMLSLDRGTVEIKTDALKTDAILTPDLRFELSDGAPLDLHIRVVPNGDTCVDNSGKAAPILHVTDTFGTSAYFIRPGQRVLFEHGSLREVVDHESSSCGCPRPDALVLAGKGKLGDGKIPEAARQNPFPEAVSQGLAQPTPPVPVTPPGEEHTQVSSTLNYSGARNTVSGPPGQETTAADLITPATTQPPAAAPTTTTPTASPTDAHIEEARKPAAGPNPFRAIGRFFQRLFGVH